MWILQVIPLFLCKVLVMFGRSKPGFEDVKKISTVTQIWAFVYLPIIAAKDLGNYSFGV